MNEIGPNFIARPYRGVSVQDVETLEPGALRSTSARAGSTAAPSSSSPCTATIARSSSSSARTATTILVPVRDARVLAGPDDVVFIADATVDTANATQLARAAAQSGRDARVYVVDGRFQHVNFIVEPAPLRIRVVEVVPPRPAKLLAMARSVLDFDEELPPIELELVPIDLLELAAAAPVRALPVPVPLRRASTSARASTSSTAARPPRPTGRWSAASARARSTPRCTAASPPSGSTSARSWSRASRATSSRCSSAACASAASSRRAAG